MAEEVMVNKRVLVRYFASLREKSGMESEEIVTNAMTVGELYGEVVRRHQFTVSSQTMRFAIDDQMVTSTAPLLDGAEVTFLPPFAGG